MLFGKIKKNKNYIIQENFTVMSKYYFLIEQVELV